MIKDTKPLVSVIIAVHNGSLYIDECLTSITSQTYNNIEIIICDDASTDDSYNKLREWQIKDDRMILLKNGCNLFAGATRNKCFEVAKGKYFMIQDVDDISMPNRVARLIEEIQTADVDFVSSSMYYFVDSPKEIVSTLHQKNEYPSKFDFLRGISFFHPATLFTADCIKAVGGYRIMEETRRCEDYDLFMRLYAQGYKGKNVKEPLYYYRLDRNTYKRGHNFDSMKGEIKVRNMNYKNLKIAPPIRWIFLIIPVLSLLMSKVRIKLLKL